MATLEDIARRVGISRAAVSMALRDYPRIGAARREEVKRVAQELGYQPDLAARALRTGQTFTIGMVISGLGVYSTNLKVEYVQQRLIVEGYQVLLGRSDAEADRSAVVMQDLINRRVDGLIFFDSIQGREALERIEASGLPAVVIDPQASLALRRVGQVCVDRAAGTYQAVRHLAFMGHRELLFCSSEMKGFAAAKWDGILAAVDDFGLHVSYGDLYEKRILTRQEAEGLRLLHGHPDYGRRYSARHEERRAYQMARQIATRAQRPTAVLLNDLTAMAFMQGLAESGLSVPGDVAVVGFDDLPSSRLCTPSLTSIRQPFRAMARQVVELLMAMIQKQAISDRHRVLQTTLKIRRSTCEDPIAAQKQLLAWGAGRPGAGQKAGGRSTVFRA